MAKHTSNGAPTNPEVRFERSDIDLGAIVKFGLGLVALVVFTIALTIVLFRFMRSYERSIKKTDLPPASVDADKLPPEPRLESIDDLRGGKPIDEAMTDLARYSSPRTALMPPRAKEYLAKQEEILAKGAKGIEPIEEAITELAGRLPHREGPGSAPPTNFTRRLPSKAASGRVSTGGQ